MELKDLVLSTIAEIDETIKEQSKRIDEVEKKPVDEVIEEPVKKLDKNFHLEVQNPIKAHETEEKEAEDEKLHESDESFEIYIDEELKFLKDLKERILVLFEGFQAPNIKSQVAKIDMMLNFFEYQLSVIEERIEKISLQKYPK